MSDHNTELPGDVVTSLFINFEWRRLISNALQSYADSIIFRLDDALVDDFRNKIQALINDLYTEDAMDNTPVGAVMWFPGIASKIPAKWLICNGATYSSATYPELYDVLRDKFPSGGSNFTVPNLTARFLYGASLDAQVSNVAGQAAVALTISELPQHSHVQRGRNTPAGGVNQSAVSVNVANTVAVDTVTTTGSTGDGVAHDNMPPYMRGYYIIKALP